MTKAQINQILRDIAKAHGFTTIDETGFQGFTEIQSEELNFTYEVQATDNTDWKAGILEQELTVRASVRKMGGNPTALDLFITGDEILRAAQLIRELEDMDLIWTETF